MYGHPMTPPKRRRRSRTYWVNGVIFALTGIESQFHILQPILSVNFYLIVCFALPLINLWLRELTTTPVGRIKNFPPPVLPLPAVPADPALPEPSHE
jgi:hypothetical protein